VFGLLIPASMSGQQFFIVSEMNGRVLDIRGANKSAGTEIIVYDKHAQNKPNQLWTIGYDGCIRSVLNDMTFMSPKEGGELKTRQADNDPRSQWSFEGQKVVNRAGEVLDIKGQNKENGAEVTSYKYNGGSNQHWRREFVN